MRARFALSLAANASIVVLCACAAWAQTTGFKTTPATVKASAYKVAIQVNENDPKEMNLALNNAKNVADYYKSKGQTVAIEIVTYGPGLHMLRSDTSPVKQRIAEMSLALPEVAFATCSNIQTNMAKQAGKDVPLLSEARAVPPGVVRLMELQRGGYAYIRP